MFSLERLNVHHSTHALASGPSPQLGAEKPEEEREAAAKSRSPLKITVSTLDGKRESFGLAAEQLPQEDEAGGDQTSATADEEDCAAKTSMPSVV